MADGDGSERLGRSYELVAKAIEQRILKRQIAPGDALPSEIALAAELGVNRSTLREALRSLEQNGLLTREAGRKKLRVSTPRATDLARRMTAAMIVQEVTFRELYEAMLALEPACAAAAAENAGATDISALEDNLARTRAAVDDSKDLVLLDVEFHRLVACASGNRALELSREPLSQLFYPAFDQIMSRLNVADRLLVAHGHIAQAIKTHDPTSARAWMDRHIADFRRGYELAHLDMCIAVGSLPDAT